MRNSIVNFSNLFQSYYSLIFNTVFKLVPIVLILYFNPIIVLFLTGADALLALAAT